MSDCDIDDTDETRESENSGKISRFYGGATKRSWLKRKRIVEARIKEMNKRGNCLPIIEGSGQLDKLKVTGFFPTQLLAFEHLEKCHRNGARDAVLFSQEKENGKRQFLVTTIDEFWPFYVEKLRNSDKHYYEIILEDRPCRLYFDIEYMEELNPDVDGYKALSSFIDYILYQIKAQYGIDCFRKDVIDLDSSTDKKFSRHLIFQIPGSLFRNNIECGQFVKSICQQAMDIYNGQSTCEEEFDSEKIKDFIIKNNKDQFVPICDLGVYTKNRNFRLFLSTKFGKTAQLKIAKENQCSNYIHSSLEPDVSNSWKLFFVDTLICMHTPADYEYSDVCLLTHDANTQMPTKCPNQVNSKRSKSQEISEDGYTGSPYPALDAFMTKQMCKGGVQGRIRRWISYPLKKLMIYDSDKNRWCGNVGRQHKSNHVYYVVDFNSGVFHQKCHDPDCYAIDYKSEDFPLPAELNPYLESSDFMVDSFQSVDDSNCQLSASHQQIASRSSFVSVDESIMFNDEGDKLLADISLDT